MPAGRERGRPAKVVVVGAGIAGLAAVESIRAHRAAVEITLIGRETSLPYYRLNLTRYLAGEIGPEELPIHPESWYQEQNVRLLLGVEATALDLAKRVVTSSAAAAVPYDKLLLAAGSHPFVPPFPGSDREGVTTLRTVEDADFILDAVARGAKCVCIGGGILGLETAVGLARRGADVTLLEGHRWLMPRQLNQPAGDLLSDHVAHSGVTLRKQARTQEILGGETVRGVLLEDGDVVPGDLVVIATGIRPNSYLARMAGLEVNRGVVVDNALRTSHPDVFAAGDLAEHRGTTYGLWGPSQYQGSIAGMNMAGVGAEFGGTGASHTLKVVGVDVFSIGHLDPEDASFTAVEEQTDGGYHLFVFRDNRLVGAILLGDTRIAAAVQKAVEETIDLSALLNKHPTAKEAAGYLAEHAF